MEDVIGAALGLVAVFLFVAGVIETWGHAHDPWKSK
jgi:hypothetical protein